MKTIKARGVVLREYEAGESDKRLTLLCKERGRLTVYARGARKPKSKFLAAAQLFTYADFILSEGPQFHSVTQAEVIEGFFGVRADYDRLRYAHYAAEICEKTVYENTPCDELLLLFLKTLSWLSRPEKSITVPPQQAGCVFLFRFFLFYGLMPETDVCCLCGALLDAPMVTFFCDEGTVCKRCAGQKPQRVSLSPPALAAMRHILSAELAAAFTFVTGTAVLQELTRAGRLFWRSHFEIPLQSEALIE